MTVKQLIEAYAGTGYCDIIIEDERNLFQYYNYKAGDQVASEYQFLEVQSFNVRIENGKYTIAIIVED